MGEWKMQGDDQGRRVWGRGGDQAGRRQGVYSMLGCASSRDMNGACSHLSAKSL